MKRYNEFPLDDSHLDTLMVDSKDIVAKKHVNIEWIVYILTWGSRRSDPFNRENAFWQNMYISLFSLWIVRSIELKLSADWSHLFLEKQNTTTCQNTHTYEETSLGYDKRDLYDDKRAKVKLDSPRVVKSEDQMLDKRWGINIQGEAPSNWDCWWVCTTVRFLTSNQCHPHA